jgi:hypothetical protein
MTIGLGAKPGEYTKVTQETEVRIPWLTYVLTSVVFMIIVAGLWLAAWLIWLQRGLDEVSAWQWMAESWSPWFSRRWPLVLLSFVPCWIGLSAWAYLYRLILEQITKTLPQYTPWNSDNGIWTPFVRQRWEDVEPEEMESGLADVNITLPDKRRRKQRKLPDFAVDRKDRAFYRAVAGGSAEFSQRGATRFGVSRSRFNKHMRDALLARGMADWKDDKHHNLGVELLDDALRTLELLGRGS